MYAWKAGSLEKKQSLMLVGKIQPQREACVLHATSDVLFQVEMNLAKGQ